jgi:hypothetical protein
MSLIGENDNTKSLRINQWQSANVGITAGSDLDYGYATPYDTDAHLVWRNDSVNVENDSLYNGVKTGNTLSNDISFDIREVGNVESQWPVNSWVDGTISELRFSLSKLSDNWIATEYKNQNSPSTFYAAGSQETQGSSNIPFGDNPAGDFADADWEYRQMLTIDASQVDADLTDFPVYVDLANMSTSFFANTNTTCGDIRVTNAAGDELAREVVACDRSAETGELHFKADSILSATDTSFFIYYGNSDANNYVVTATYGAQNVWNSNYELVYHSGGGSDSTSNGRHGTASGGVTVGGVAGQLGDATDFDGVNDYIDSGWAGIGGANARTVSVWLQTTGSDSPDNFLDWGDYLNGQRWTTRVDSTGNLRTEVDGGYQIASTQIADNAKHLIHSVLPAGGGDVTSVVMYVDGLDDGTSEERSQSINTSLNGTVEVGGNTGLGRYAEATIDEVRVLSIDVSADWISAEYNNQNDPAAFYTFSTPQAGSEIFGNNPNGDWGDRDWNSREKITINASEVDGNSTNFPVYIDLSDFDSDFFTGIRDDGGDIRVTTGDGLTELPREVVSVDTSAESGELHFKADSISATTDTDFYIYYDNREAVDYAVDATYGRNGVWSDYDIVYHMNQDPDTDSLQDSTGNGHNGTYQNMTSANLVDTPMGKGIEFVSTDTTYITVPHDSIMADWTTELTVTVFDNTYGFHDRATYLSKGVGDDFDQTFYIRTIDEFIFGAGRDGDSAYNFFGYADPYLDSFIHKAGIYSNSGGFTYIMTNGIIGTGAEDFHTPTGESQNNAADLVIGSMLRPTPDDLHDGVISEIRLKGTADTTERIATENNNLSNPGSFYTVYQEPIEVSSIEDLNNIRDDLSNSYELTRDLDFNDCASYDDCSNKDTYTTGSGWEAIGSPASPFTGSFDFKGNSISELMIDRPSTRFQGLFSASDGGFYIGNGQLVNYDITASDWSAGLVGRNYNNETGSGLIENIAVSGSMDGGSEDNIASLIGWSQTSSITVRNIKSQSDVISGNWSGGVIGESGSGSLLTNMIFIGTVTSSFDTGGISYYTFIDNSFYDQDVAGEVYARDPGNATTTVAMQDIDTYLNAGWDIVPIDQHDGQESTATWFIDNGNDYPRLWFERDDVPFGDNTSGDFKDTDWEYREKITIQASQVNSTLTDFPVYIDLSDLDSEFFANVKSDGGDIRVTNAAGTELAREVVSVNTTAGTGELHFKAPSLSSSSDTDFYIYYGSSATDYAADATYGAETVWSDYQGVYHLESHEALVDSTGNGNDGFSGGTLSTAGDVLGNGVDFSLGFMEFGFSHTDNGLKGVMGWMRDWGSYEDVYSQNGVSDYAFNIYTQTSALLSYMGGGTGHAVATGLNRGEQLHIVNQYDGTNEHSYLNGVEANDSPETVSAPGDDGNLFQLGRWFADANDDAGVWDEFRTYSEKNFSDAYIYASYTNQNTPSTFYTVGQSQTVDETAAEGNSATEIRGGEFRGGVEFR